MTAIGPKPKFGPGVDTWRVAALAIRNYRERYRVTDQSDALGPEPVTGRRAQDYEFVERLADRHEHTARETFSRTHGRELGIDLSV